MPALSPGEHMAFRELSRKLSQGLAAIGIEHQPRNARRPQLEDAPAPVQAQLVGAVLDLRPLLDRVPVAILIYRLSQLLYANPAFLQWWRHLTRATLIEAGGLDRVLLV